MNAQQLMTYKVLFLGDGGVGKTTYIRAIRGEAFSPKYNPTLGVDVTPFRMNLEERKVLNIWECAGQEKFSGLGDGYYIQSQAAVFFFSLDSPASFKNMMSWINDCYRVTNNIPFVVVATKSDIVPSKVTDEEIRQVLGDTPVFKVSSKTGTGLMEPLTALLQKL